MKSNKVEVVIPFSGFYNTLAGEYVTRFTENDMYEASDEMKVLIEKFNCVADNTECEELFAKAYVTEFFHMLNTALAKANQPLLAIEASPCVESPREYNFRNDRLFAEVDRDTMVTLWNWIRNDPGLRPILKQVLSQSFRSYDGFLSYYDDAIEAWEEKDPTEFDCNEFGVVLSTLAIAIGGSYSNWACNIILNCCDECKYQASWGDEADKILDEINNLERKEGEI